MVRDPLDCGLLFENRHDLLGMSADGIRHVLLGVRTGLVPPQHDLVMAGIPHEHQRIQPAIERPLVIDEAPAGLGLKGGAEKPFSLRIRHQCDLRAVQVGKCAGLQTTIDSAGDFLACKKGPQHAVRIGKPAADVAVEAGATRYRLRQAEGCP